MVPASFGVGRRLSGSPVKPEATITEAVDRAQFSNNNRINSESIFMNDGSGFIKLA